MASRHYTPPRIIWRGRDWTNAVEAAKVGATLLGFGLCVFAVALAAHGLHLAWDYGNAHPAAAQRIGAKALASAMVVIVLCCLYAIWPRKVKEDA